MTPVSAREDPAHFWTPFPRMLVGTLEVRVQSAHMTPLMQQLPVYEAPPVVCVCVPVMQLNLWNRAIFRTFHNPICSVMDRNGHGGGGYNCPPFTPLPDVPLGAMEDSISEKFHWVLTERANWKIKSLLLEISVKWIAHEWVLWFSGEISLINFNHHWIWYLFKSKTIVCRKYDDA